MASTAWRKRGLSVAHDSGELELHHRYGGKLDRGSRLPTGAAAERSALKPQRGSREGELGSDENLGNLKAQPQGCAFCSKAMPSKSPQTAPPTGEQVFRCPRLQRTFSPHYVQPPQSSQGALRPRWSCSDPKPKAILSLKWLLSGTLSWQQEK